MNQCFDELKNVKKEISGIRNYEVEYEYYDPNFVRRRAPEDYSVLQSIKKNEREEIQNYLFDFKKN